MNEQRLEVKDNMWVRLKATGDTQLRDEIITGYLHLVKIIAKKMSAMYRGYSDMDDIVGQGILALIDAVEKFDPDKGVKFETFASIKIKGAVIDYIRKQDWVPRGLRRRAKDMEEAFFRLRSELGREATDEELAGRLAIAPDDLTRLMSETYRFNLLSYEELLYESVSQLENQKSGDQPDSMLQEQEMQEMMQKAITALNEKEQLVVSLYYYEGLKLKEIAEVLEVSEARVCQIHSKSLMKLKGSIAEYFAV